MNILKWLIKIILTGLSFPLLIFPFSPRPACLFLRNLFRFGTYIRPRDYAFARASVRIERDLPYRERNVRCSRLDIISPAAVSAPPLPVLFWLHGGAYVGGDKSDVEGYAVQIAACGYIVANINYPLAPESPYPSGDVYKRQGMGRFWSCGRLQRPADGLQKLQGTVPCR